MWLIWTEWLLAILLIVLVCRTKCYLMGTLLLFALCMGFFGIGIAKSGWDDHVQTYLIPFVFGLPAIVVARGRCIANSVSPAERERRAIEAARIYGPSPLGALFFGVLSFLVVLVMLSTWSVVDLDGGRVRVERRTWWGLGVVRKEFPQDEVAQVEVVKRERRSIRGAIWHFNSLIFRQYDGKTIGSTGGGYWGLGVQEDADTLAAELKKGSVGHFHEWSFVFVGPLIPFLMAFLLLTLLLRRGLVRPRKEQAPLGTGESNHNFSLANVLKRARGN